MHERKCESESESESESVVGLVSCPPPAPVPRPGPPPAYCHYHHHHPQVATVRNKPLNDLSIKYACYTIQYTDPIGMYTLHNTQHTLYYINIIL